MPQVSGGHLRGSPDCGDVTQGGFMSTAGKVHGAFPGLFLFSGAGENQ